MGADSAPEGTFGNQHLETFLVVTIGQGEGTTGIWWIEAAKCPTMHRTVPTKKNGGANWTSDRATENQYRSSRPGRQLSFLFFKIYFLKFIYLFWLRWVLVVACGIFLVAA